MRVLVACEESQRVTSAFRKRGHEAYSCDVQTCALYDHLEWHILDDARKVINGHCSFMTMDGNTHILRGVGPADRTPAVHVSDQSGRRKTAKQ
jgi:hypothetical protein